MANLIVFIIIALIVTASIRKIVIEKKTVLNVLDAHQVEKATVIVTLNKF
jgi:hypothetical protein